MIWKIIYKITYPLVFTKRVSVIQISSLWAAFPKLSTNWILSKMNKRCFQRSLLTIDKIAACSSKNSSFRGLTRPFNGELKTWSNVDITLSSRRLESKIYPPKNHQNDYRKNFSLISNLKLSFIVQWWGMVNGKG